LPPAGRSDHHSPGRWCDLVRPQFFTSGAAGFPRSAGGPESVGGPPQWENIGHGWPGDAADRDLLALLVEEPWAVMTWLAGGPIGSGAGREFCTFPDDGAATVLFSTDFMTSHYPSVVVGIGFVGPTIRSRKSFFMPISEKELKIRACGSATVISLVFGPLRIPATVLRRRNIRGQIRGNPGLNMFCRLQTRKKQICAT